MKPITVRIFGTLLGLIIGAYGAAVAFGFTTGAVPCRTSCQLNESLKILLGEVAANRIIGGLLILTGVMYVVFLNVRGPSGDRGRLSSKGKRTRRRSKGYRRKD
jgi:uncharacterized membrane protein